MKIVPATIAVLLLLLAGCGDGDGGDGGRKPAAAPSPTQGPYLSCVPANEGTRFEVRSASGATLTGAIIGSGTRGVVFSNTADGSPCDWIVLARELAGKGYQVAFWTYRNTDLDALKDLDAVTAEVRKRGAAKVVLVGGSRGGCLSMIGAVEVSPPVSGVAVLSCARLYNRDNPTEMAPYIAKARLPVFYATGEQDGRPTVAEVRAEFAAVPSADKNLVVVPGSSSHGDVLLTDPVAAPLVRPALVSFLDRVTA